MTLQRHDPSQSRSEVDDNQGAARLKPLLTIGYPTYERVDAIESAVSTALERLEGLPVELLVADNASRDGTAARLASRFGGSQLRLIAGERNLGWQGNISRLINCSAGEFLMFVSDEDDISSGSSLRDLTDLLMSRPELALLTTGEGRASNSHNQIDAKHLWKETNYLSGTVLSVGAAKKWLSILDELRFRHDISELWELYPHYLLAVGIWISGNECAHFAQNVCERAREYPMRWSPPHRDAGDAELRRVGHQLLGKAYLRSISSNIIQHANLALFVNVVAETMHADPNRVLDIREWQSSRVARRIDDLMLDYFPELHPLWQNGVKRRFASNRTRSQPLASISRWLA